jgi:hypothetical protein
MSTRSSSSAGSSSQAHLGLSFDIFHPLPTTPRFIRASSCIALIITFPMQFESPRSMQYRGSYSLYAFYWGI